MLTRPHTRNRTFGLHFFPSVSSRLVTEFVPTTSAGSPHRLRLRRARVDPDPDSGTIPKTVSDKEWWQTTDAKFQAWPRTAGPPVIMNPISRQNFIVKSTE
ncbi:hypothetical protein GQ55_9G097400 [Panicum hallii var. hallii]|uniref:Uncharacterized protein n=2 Tax=Panicum hallii TaxID=206008 RepID=A0A2T7C1R2_9POAL|nr:hypothetical protein GQ55_9G097400 [Panicum hallii var. hallii]PVH31266.1 hypothetical protein PAHAL_9G100300 [Panicum hallii]